MGQAILSFLEKEEKYIFDKFAKQCSGSVYLQSGNNVVLATVAIDTQEVVEEDFLPLTVQYIEKAYAAGKFPGGYIKREAKPGDFETLSARIVDRSLRPLFPKGYCYPTQITILVLSADQDADLQLLALNAASAALYVSEIPLYSPVSAVRIGKIGDNFVINPSLKQLEESSLDLFVSGVNEDLLMIEMRTFGGIKTQEGQAIFKTLFGYDSKSYIAPSYTWDDDIERMLQNINVQILQGGLYQVFSPYFMEKTQCRLVRHYNGQKSIYGQVYLMRNTHFEPTLIKHVDLVNKCMGDIKRAFRWRKPAIISVHRLNFIGNLEENNRKETLKQLALLLRQILTKFPEVEFMTSDELGKEMLR